MLCSIRLTQCRVLIITTEMLVNADQQVTSLIKKYWGIKNPEVEMRDPQKRSCQSSNIYWVSKNEISYEKKWLIFIFVDKVIVPFGSQTRSSTRVLGHLFGNKQRCQGIQRIRLSWTHCHPAGGKSSYKKGYSSPSYSRDGHKGFRDRDDGSRKRGSGSYRGLS